MMKKVLTIAGSDCSGGAGIQADLKTISSHGMYGMSVITALTAQNTQGVTRIQNVDVEMVKAQIDAIFTDIEPDSIKIGMVSNTDIILAISERLAFYKCKNIVYDPVMVSTSGSKLLEEDTIDVIIKNLLPLATVITPNIYEAEVLAKMKINTDKDMASAIEKIKTFYNGSILIKGGHAKAHCNDYLYENHQFHIIQGRRIENENTHGTGCTLSSAIACNLADEQTVYNSIVNGKIFITKAIDKMLNLGKGRGPLNHFVPVTGGSLYRSLVQDNRLAWESYVNHEIKDGLIYETIDMDKFKAYIKQDYAYITCYKKYITLLFEETGEPLFEDMAKSCDEEHLLHKQYVDDVEKVVVSKETQDYIDYFDHIFRVGSLEEKMVALAPCFIGYAEFGRHICQHSISKGNKFAMWIEAYNSEDYVDKTQEYIRRMDCFGVCENFETLSRIFKEVIHLEIAFFRQML